MVVERPQCDEVDRFLEQPHPPEVDCYGCGIAERLENKVCSPHGEEMTPPKNKYLGIYKSIPPL